MVRLKTLVMEQWSILVYHPTKNMKMNMLRYMQKIMLIMAVIL